MTVQYRDGIELTLSDGTRVVCDADVPDGDVNIVTHAHGDHYPDGEATAVCSPLTAEIATARRDDPLHRTTDDRVELLPAGHVAGSRAALVTDPDGTRYLYTGDICTRPRFYLDGVEPPSADVLITEATYGEPGYVFPEHDTLMDDIRTWLQDTDDPVLLMGYAFGRAQKLQLLANRSDRDRVFTTDAVIRVNEAIEAHLDVTFDVQRYEDETTLQSGDALILPMTSGRINWIDQLAEDTGAVKAGFSGWAIDRSFKFRGDYDVTFPLSDHCDFEELLDVVATVDPDQVYTQHGSAAELAEHLTDEGYEATSLRQNQFSLEDF